MQDPKDATGPANTVLIGEHDDADRMAASQNLPNENVTTVSSQNPPLSNQQPIQPPHPSVMLPGEHVIWKRTFSKGIIHRHPTVLEVVTNKRALVVDEKLRAIVRAVPLANCQVVVANVRRISSGFRAGYGRQGAFASRGIGTSEARGDIEFINQGRVICVFHNLDDPYGIRELIEAVVRSSSS
jgi:hypothetical protein